MVATMNRVTRSPRHRGAVIVAGTLVCVAILAAHSAPEGSGGHMGSEMATGAAMCLAVLAGGLGLGLATTAKRVVVAPKIAVRIISATGGWAVPVPRIEPVARAGPPLFQVFRL